jgi:3-methyladenine DNA glycosylase AlkD
MKTVVAKISAELEQLADEKTRLGSQRFFKEEIRLHGVKSAMVQSVDRTYFKKIKSHSKEEIFKLCEELWQTGYFEESIIACNWACSQSKHFKPSDFDLFERWIDTYITNWASCDTFCNHTMGAFIELYPHYAHKLKQMAKSDNRWMRRAAAVSLIVPARKGLFLNDCLEIAELLLNDNDDMVQKGYGWLLKVAADKHQQVVLNFVLARKESMPRTALRYAIEKMPAELKAMAMAKPKTRKAVAVRARSL